MSERLNGIHRWSGPRQAYMKCKQLEAITKEAKELGENRNSLKSNEGELGDIGKEPKEEDWEKEENI